MVTICTRKIVTDIFYVLRTQCLCHVFAWIWKETTIISFGVECCLFSKRSVFTARARTEFL